MNTSVQDVIKRSFIETQRFAAENLPKLIGSLLLAFVMGCIIYFVYRRFYTGVVFSRSFAVTLVGMTVLTCMVTLAISTNVVISLGWSGPCPSCVIGRRLRIPWTCSISFGPLPRALR